MVKNPPSNAEDAGSILGRGTKIPHASEQLSPPATATEPTLHKERSHVWQLRRNTAKKEGKKRNIRSIWKDFPAGAVVKNGTHTHTHTHTHARNLVMFFQKAR